MGEPLLSLETLIERPTIDIDGQRYEMLSPDELSVLDSHRFSKWAGRLEELQKAGEESPEMDEIADRIARKALIGVPEDVLEKLTGVHKIAVAEVFIGLLLRSRMGVAGAIAKAMGSSQIGELFSQGFNGSTAATRGSGWRARLSRLFGRT